MKIIGDNMDRLMAGAASKAGRVLATEISGKALLYFVPLFLTPFADKLGALLMQGTWPSAPQFLYCTLLGLSAACIGLRAFYDGSYQRDKEDKADAGQPKP